MWFTINLSTSINLWCLYILIFITTCISAEPNKCPFSETVNITSYFKFPNGSYLHDGILIPPKFTDVYNYIYVSGIRIEVQQHVRACVCQLRTCINICRAWQNLNETAELSPADFNINITQFDNTVIEVNIYEKYEVIIKRPDCEMYQLALYTDEWIVHEDATVSISNSIAHSFHDMCFVPERLDDRNGTVVLVPVLCTEEDIPLVISRLNASAMLFSIPFMVLTIAVYLIVPELRNLHGKSLVSYLFGLIMGYSFLSHMIIAGNDNSYDLKCKFIGYTTYFFFMSAFFWLNIISFDLWHNFRGTRGVTRYEEKRRFIFYCIYAWGLAAIFLLLTWTVQDFLDIDEQLKPGIAGGEFCWINTRSWAALIYFYAPIIAIITCNTVMFVMTAIKIHRVQRDMARVMAKNDSNRNLRMEKDRFGLFLRLLVIMGVTWTMEILSYFVGPDSSWSVLFYATDICNAIQGFLIFMLFVMKKNIKNLIMRRFPWMCKKTNQGQNQSSCRTATSSVGNSTTHVTEQIPLQTNNA